MASDDGSYRLKRIEFGGKRRAIVMQSLNGPCPLLAIANALTLRGDISDLAHDDSVYVSPEHVASVIADCLLRRSAPSGSSAEEFDQQKHEALSILPSLNGGLDVNLSFTKGPSSFEYTQSLTVFDVAGIPLVHGWLVDPQDAEMQSALAGLTFNTARERSKAAGGAGPNAEMLDHWFAATASQLTVYGLAQLHLAVAEGSVAVLFRSNHFSVLTRRSGQLYVLVTDIGYASSPVVWERLASEDGDTQLFSDDFRAWVAPREDRSPVPTIVLPNEEAKGKGKERVAEAPPSAAGAVDTDRDMALAMQLQEQESNAKERGDQEADPWYESQVRHAQRRRNRGRRNEDCTLL